MSCSINPIKFTKLCGTFNAIMTTLDLFNDLKTQLSLNMCFTHCVVKVKKVLSPSHPMKTETWNHTHDIEWGSKLGYRNFLKSCANSFFIFTLWLPDLKLRWSQFRAVFNICGKYIWLQQAIKNRQETQEDIDKELTYKDNN